MKYEKIGVGKVLKCWESKIRRLYDGEVLNDKLVCKKCGNVLGEVESNFIKMNQSEYTYTGTKIKK